MTPKRTHYRTLELSEITGMTLRRLQWLDEQGMIRPATDSGASVRRYSVAQAVEIAIISELRGKGVSLRQVCRFQKEIRSGIRDTERITGDASVFLVIAGNTAYICWTAKEVISIACKSSKPIVLVDIVRHFSLFV